MWRSKRPGCSSKCSPIPRGGRGGSHHQREPNLFCVPCHFVLPLIHCSPFGMWLGRTSQSYEGGRQRKCCCQSSFWFACRIPMPPNIPGQPRFLQSEFNLDRMMPTGREHEVTKVLEEDIDIQAAESLHGVVAHMVSAIKEVGRGVSLCGRTVGMVMRTCRQRFRRHRWHPYTA